MCLVACYWARLPRVVFAATTDDVASARFEDLQLYRELTYPADKRSIREDAADADIRRRAADVLGSWVKQLPVPTEPKF